MGTVIRRTRALCPRCLRNLPAALVRHGDGHITLERTCPDHGGSAVTVWRGALDFEAWTAGAEPLGPGAGEACPGSCGLCAEHGSGACCVLLEVTRRCDLRCRFCFAHGGEDAGAAEPDLNALKAAVDDIAAKCGGVLLQLSGGEPTLRSDLPELVRHAKAAGCSAVQVNTNGLRLAREPDYARALAEAGLDIVFLQFDGTDDAVYTALRGRPLLAEKTEAIRVCGELGLGVTLVPTVVPGVNTQALGALVRFAAARVPAVRGVHFQPVSYFGRCPDAPRDADRYPLDALLRDVAAQTGVPAESFLPSRCDHPLCGFHATLLVGPDGALKPLGGSTRAPGCRGTAKENRDYIARHWRGVPPAEEEPAPALSDEMDFDTFLYLLRRRSLLLSAMAFQDAGTLNAERLARCSLLVYEGGKVMPFCARYIAGA